MVQAQKKATTMLKRTNHHLEFNIRYFLFSGQSNSLPIFRRHSLMILDHLFGISAIINKFHDRLRGISFVSV